MISRQMESHAAPPASTRDTGDVAEALLALLRRPVGRLLVFGLEIRSEDLTTLADEAVCRNEIVEVPEDAAPFDAAICAAPAPDLVGALGVLRRCLVDSGRLALLTFAPPADADAVARVLIRALSEEGFVLVKEGALAPALALGGTEPSGVSLVARRASFHVRLYRDGDESAILSLFPACFFVERSLDHWRWKYRDNPWGGHHLSMAFTPQGELAAHYGGYPVPFWIAGPGDRDGHDGHDFLALQMGDTMTHPDHRRVGRGTTTLLGRTVRHFFAVYREGPFGFYYGFNTGAIQRFCGWFIGGSQVESVGYWARQRPEPGGWAATDWQGSGYRIERVRQVDAAWDRLFRRAAPFYGFLVRRDAAWLRWRYLECPDAEFALFAARRWGRLVGWIVVRRREERLVWGDALFHPRHLRAAGPLLGAALADPLFADTERIEAWFPERPEPWRNQLVDLGFERSAEPNDLAFMMLPDVEPEAAARLPELYYTMGDGDLF